LTTINARLDEIGSLSWTEVDEHIDSAFSALSTAQKTSLKKLYKSVLGLIKLR
jgi:hypothetical protein